MLLTLDAVKVYDITTPVAKKDANVNSSSADAYTWVVGKPFDVVADYVYESASGVMMWAPTSGATTSSVHRTRTELKSHEFYFKDAQIHKAKLCVKLHKINWFKSVVIMQAHCADGNDPSNKTFLEVKEDGTGRLLNGMRTTNSTADPKKLLLLDNIDLSQPFFVEYCITQYGFFTVDAYQGQNTGHLEGQLDEQRASRPHVYHFGAYNQINEGSASEPEGDGTLIELLELLEYHGDIPVAPPVEEVDPYEEIQKRIDILQETYFTSLKALQTSIKSELNLITTEMKSLTDKDKTSPIYVEIKAFKADMTNGLVRTS